MTAVATRPGPVCRAGARDGVARGGHALAAAGLGLAFLTYFATFLPWKIGIWSDIDPVIVALHASAGVAAMGLVAMVWAGRGRALGALCHPYVVVFAAAAAVAVATAPFARYPIESLVGEPETAEGALLYGEFAVLVAAGLAVRAHRPTLRALVWGGAAVSWLAAGLTAAGAGGFVFGDWLAFYAIGIAVAVAAGGGTVRIAGRRMSGAALGVAAALPSLAVSLNLTAVALAILAGVPLWLAVHALRHRTRRGVRAIRRGGAVLAALMPAGVIAGVAWLGPMGLIESIRSRARVDDVVFAQFAHVPGTLVHGQGWGQAGETFMRYLTAAGANTYDGSWDLVFRDYLHTHDYALEALLAGGAAALALALLTVAMAPLWSRRRDLPLAVPFAVVLSGVAAFWFQLPMTLPALALALAAIGRPVAARPRPRLRPFFVEVLALLAAASFVAAAFLLQFELGVRAALHGPVPVERVGNGPCLDFPAEAWRGDIGLRYALVRAYTPLVRPGAPLNIPQVLRAAALACEVDRRSRDSRSALLLSAGLLLRSEVAFNPRLRSLHPVFARSLEDWPARLRHFLEVAPDRADLAISYFGWRLQAGDSAAIASLAADILALRPSDPVGLWFSGLVMLESPDRARKRAGLFRLRRALDGGIERLMPIDAGQRARIMALTGGARTR